MRRSRRAGRPRLLGLLLTCTLLAAGGCVTLPRFAPGPIRAGPPPEIAGAQGSPLPPGRAEALWAGLPAPLQRHLAFAQAVTGQPLYAGNQAQLLVDGPAALTAMVQAMGAARRHIHLEVFVFADDPVGREVADLLLRKQAEGVQVRLLYDSLGSEKTPRRFFQRLAAGGIAVAEFNPMAGGLLAYRHRDHRKILVVDGQVAYTGGINISAAYTLSSEAYRQAHRAPSRSAGLRDTSVQVRGPAVAAFQALFLDTWRRLRGPGPPPLPPPAPAAAGPALVRVVGSGEGAGRGAMYLALLSAIAHARESAYLTTAFFVPDRQLLAVLAGAARRGVDVQLLVPGFTDHPVVQAAGRAHYAELLRAGVRIYEERGVLLHAKTAVIDGLWSSVGSTNLDPLSFVRNLEVDAVVIDGDFGREMRAVFEADRARATRITAAAWAARPLRARLLERYARLWKGLF